MDYPEIKIVGETTSDVITIKESQLLDTSELNINCRHNGNLKYISFYLPDTYKGRVVISWIITKDNNAYICLVPIMQEESD